MKCAMEMAMMVAENAMMEEQKKREQQAEEARREREREMEMKANFIKHIDEITNILETALFKGNGKASILLKDKAAWHVKNAVSFVEPRYGSRHSNPVNFEDLIQSGDNVVSLLDVVEFLKQHCYTVSWKRANYLTYSWSGKSTYHNDVVYLNVSI